jgi:hypothetical protein
MASSRAASAPARSQPDALGALERFAAAISDPSRRAEVVPLHAALFATRLTGAELAGPRGMVALERMGDWAAAVCDALLAPGAPPPAPGDAASLQVFATAARFVAASDAFWELDAHSLSAPLVPAAMRVVRLHGERCGGGPFGGGGGPGGGASPAAAIVLERAAQAAAEVAALCLLAACQAAIRRNDGV